MASGSFKIGHIVDPRTGSIIFEAEANWTAVTNIQDNSSTVTVKILARTFSIGNVNGYWYFHIKIDDVLKDDGYNYSLGSDWTEMLSYTRVVKHNELGEGQCRLYAKVYAPAGKLNASVIENSITAQLDDIPKSASITSAADIQLGSNCDIRWDVLATSFSYRLDFYIGGWQVKTPPIYPGHIGKFVYNSFVIPIEVAKQLPNSSSGLMNVRLTTYTDSSCRHSVGSPSVKTFSITIPSNIIPKTSNVSISLDNSVSSVINSWGIAVSGYTKLNVTATATGTYGSSVVGFYTTGAYNTSVNSNNLNYTGDAIVGYGNKYVDVYCVDTRNRKSKAIRSNSVYFYDYKKPSIKVFAARRDEANRNKVHINVSWTASSVNGLNESHGNLYYKSPNDPNYIFYGDIQNNTQTLLSIDFNENKSYGFKIIVSDSIGNSIENTSIISTKKVLLDFKAGGRGFGIGKVAETDSVEIELDSRFFGEIYFKNQLLSEYIKSLIPNVDEEAIIKSTLDRAYPVGAIYISMQDKSPAQLFGGTWERLKEKFLFAANEDNNSYKVGSTGGEERHKLTEKELPIIDGSWATGVVSRHGERGVTGHAYGTSFPNITDAYDSTSANSQWGYGYKFGGDKSHNNMPPYLAVYMWQRVS